MTDVQTNPRGIPKAPFVDRVNEFTGGDYEGTLNKFNEMLSKYKFMETHLIQRQASLQSKIPEIRKSLEMVVFLSKQNDETELDFELNDTLWLNAVVPKTEHVNLWLGANVMLQYPIKEAEELLTQKLMAAKASQQQVAEDLEFLKEQITTMEVNIARVYNEDVKIRRSKKVQSE
ncbi:Prefoldin subunit-domain-containing protein [Gorgonomyces haynaldii]|nr:Prefoldin subunit-domain-containing protein [Gorgonomyces haynaldii]